MIPPKVLNLRTWTDIYKIPSEKPVEVVRVDRLSTGYGNPFITEVESERDWACDMFMEYAIWRIQKQPTWLKNLRGKHLACWCSPKRCHADTLLILANYPLQDALKKLEGPLCQG